MAELHNPSSLEDLSLGSEDLHEFHDPFSDVSLFLSKQLRAFMDNESLDSLKWSYKIEEKLLETLSIPFQKAFPKYRLNIFSIKKVWEKIVFYLDQMKKKEAVCSLNGVINIDYLISENLKESLTLSMAFPAHPFYLAYQIATRIAEFVASVEGKRLHIDRLAKKIWQLQRHLIADYRKQKSPQNERDKIDKLIIKTILEISAKEPLISHRDLKDKVLENLFSFQDLPSWQSLEDLHANICALLSEKLYEISPLHSLLTQIQKNALENFIKRHAEWLKISNPSLSRENRVRRIFSLYTLATHLPKNLPREALFLATSSCYPFSSEKPELPQSLFAFIAAEIVLMRGDHFCHSQEHVVNLIEQAYLEAVELPLLQAHTLEYFEVFIWKNLTQSESILDQLPYKIGQRIECEVANAMIDNPKASFSTLVTTTLKFFKRTKALTENSNQKEIEEKVHQWTLQSDMLLQSVNLDTEGALVQEIFKVIEEKKESLSALPHTAIVSEANQRYLSKYPELSMYAPRLTSRIWTLYKHLWYTQLSSAKESALERFFMWHAKHLKTLCSDMPNDQIQAYLKEICRKRLPAIPTTFFDEWWKRFFSEK